VKEEVEQSVIRLVARHRQPDPVLVGVTGASDLRHSLPGSTAAHALRELRSDVLLVRADAALFELP
jgi:nucleotide-binding universal stress UspA family protein